MTLDDFGTNVQKENIGVLTAGEAPEEVCKERAQENFDFSQWAVQINNSFRPTTKTSPMIPSGYYEIEIDNFGEPIFIKKDLITDELLVLDDIAKSIVQEITLFWEKESLFQNYGFTHRRGYLFYGRAGTGKTSIVKQILQQIIEKGGVAISCQNRPEWIIKAINRFRMIEPKRILLCIFEEIEAIIDKFREERILSLVDGENLTDNVLNIATTNYPEKLDKRIVSRPRRFDRIIKIGDPSDSVRRKYFREKLGLEGSDVEKYVEVSKGFTFASLSDLVISTKCFDIPLNEAVERLRDLEKGKSSDEYYHNRMGMV